ncbi:C40 family peptidase [Rahnella aquatilis]|uniref:Cell wall-associated hydrolase, invasion-associated protein n=1 Tax=Rahnella aquatilis (strain ATCC 33071 / DSM 4594 / JCM 1683 / NBRC 105701 / NCIMB 13365 / CIP 78.65) TaxID=745277 RepID=H2ISJ8_RAHAC|nr:C40 family peptidase [Rahnella aquatilis]AEX52646.1 cell wall-associated hydrolase, invasion-associated protein [Rahnella aquatilis CIP 78.65 = ATCC 33071]
MRLLFTLFVLLFTQLFLNMAHASPQTRVSADQRKSHVNQAAPEERRKRKTAAAKTSKKTKITPVTEQKTQDKNSKKKVKSTELVKRKTTTEKSVRTTRAESKKEKTLKTTRAESRTEKHAKTRALAKNSTERASKKEAYGRHRKGKKSEEDSKPITLSATHKKRYQHAQQTAMTKLMHQVGKPYRWGGTSPNTGFDCSGLVYYAYKDLIRIKMPRTANEMYHLRDAAPVKRGELESGDLVFFRINNRGAADHVGVYVGNGKFIQSPRTGEDIKITSLGDDYWQDHYVGARRVMTPKTIR